MGICMSEPEFRSLPPSFETDEAYTANDEWEYPSTARQYPPPPKTREQNPSLWVRLWRAVYLWF
jgi:hypothetical protein